LVPPRPGVLRLITPQLNLRQTKSRLFNALIAAAAVLGRVGVEVYCGAESDSECDSDASIPVQGTTWNKISGCGGVS
jgi:hypothetical protein